MLWMVLNVVSGGQSVQVNRYIPIPVALRVLVQRGEHDRQDGPNIVANKVAEIFVVPEV